MIRVDETDPVGELEPSFPYRDVTIRKGVEFKNDYDIESEIGRGKFGTVYRCKEKKTGLALAAKVVNIARKEDRRSVEREVDIMRRLQHPRLIQLYDAIEHGKQIYVVLELIQGGELFERVIDDDFVLTERSCAVFMRQICEGIEFVHSQNILHLDMKPENILCLTKEGNRIKIIDFGLAREYDPKKKLQVLFGTPEFVAPEVVNFDQIGFGTDMWSIGVICYVLLSGLSPFMGDTDIETMANVTIAKYDFDHEAFADISEDAKDFIRGLLLKDITKRASAKQCREHHWLQPTTATNSNKVLVDTIIKVNGTTKVPVAPKAETAAAASTSNVELDVTKDNLRLFVERWREHPDSPYYIENNGLASPMELRHSQETVSLRGGSPSPRGSICSSSSSTSGDSSSPDGPGSFLSVPDHAWALERRASEGRGTDRTKMDPASQILLAEEIIRLSEHLRTIAMAPTKKEDKPKKNVGVEKAKAKSSVARMRKEMESDVNEISEKLSNIHRQRKINGTTFNGSRNLDKYNTVNDTAGSASNFFSLKKTSKISNSTGSSCTTTTTTFSSNGSNGSSSSSRTTTSTAEDSPVRPREMDLTPPWRQQARAKKRFGETCRDVPRIATLQDLHKNMNLDEPTSTKNLLLKLIDEWGDLRRPGGLGGGRKSISVDWCGEENVGRKSIDSLAQYFQSERQKVNTATSSSSIR